MRSTIGGLLRQAGHTTDADLVASPESTLTRLDTPFLSTWRIVQVDYRAPAHPVLLHLAVGGSQAYRLTGDPMAFNRMTAADGTRVTDPQTAVRLVRMFLETTRPAGELTYLVEGVDDIRFRPGLTETQARRRDQIVARYRDRISPPLATAAGGGFVVTAHTVRAGTLWHHTLSVTAAGRLSDVADPLADDLPTPHAG